MFHLVKNIVAISSLFTLVYSDRDATLQTYTNNLWRNGYNFRFITSDGIIRSESAVISPEEDGNLLIVKGDYSYISPDETPVHVSYVAGEGGYRAKFHIGKIEMPPKMPPRPGTAVSYAFVISSPAFNSLPGGGLSKDSMAMVIPKFTRPSVRMLAKTPKKMLKLRKNSKISSTLNDLLTVGKKYRRRQAYYYVA